MNKLSWVLNHWEGQLFNINVHALHRTYCNKIRDIEMQMRSINANDENTASEELPLLIGSLILKDSLCFLHLLICGHCPDMYACVVLFGSINRTIKSFYNDDRSSVEPAASLPQHPSSFSLSTALCWQVFWLGLWCTKYMWVLKSDSQKYDIRIYSAIPRLAECLTII